MGMSDDEKAELREFVKEMRELRGEIREYRKNQEARCANHSVRIEKLHDEQTKIKSAIAYSEEKDQPNLAPRVSTIEKIVESAASIIKALGWLIGSAAAAYAIFAFFVNSVIQHGAK